MRLEKELRETNIYINNLLQDANELNEVNQELNKRLDHMEQCSAYQAYQDAENTIQALQSELNRIHERIPAGLLNTSMSGDINTESIQMEMELISLRNRVKELELIVKEDEQRIKNLCEECRDLNVRYTNESILMEKYKIGYTNVKKRNENTKKQCVERIVNELNSESRYYRCIEMMSNDNVCSCDIRRNRVLSTIT